MAIIPKQNPHLLAKHHPARTQRCGARAGLAGPRHGHRCQISRQQPWRGERDNARTVIAGRRFQFKLEPVSNKACRKIPSLSFYQQAVY
eukprot:6212651-Pleurochrysis_carterae.AAC.4